MRSAKGMELWSWRISNLNGARVLLMLDREALAAAVKGLRDDAAFTRVESFALRSIALRHFLPPKVPDPLFAPAAGALGSRFVPPNRPTKGLYLAEDAETAHREGNQVFYQAHAKMYGGGLGYDELLPPAEVVLIGVMVIASRLLNVRDPEVQARLGTSAEELASPWKTVDDAPTQRLGDLLASDGGFEGLIYESVQCPSHSCLVLFPDCLGGGSLIAFRSRTVGVPSGQIDRWSILSSEP